MKTYALVGTGGRAGLYLEAIARDYKDTARFVAFCDSNETRMAYANQIVTGLGHAPVPCWRAENFEQMIRECKPDIVIVRLLSSGSAPGLICFLPS